jgi:hypothetical protein
MTETLYKQKTNSRHGLVTWRMLAPEIGVELAKGWSKSEVYSRYSDRLKISYSQFTRYCRTLNQLSAQSAACAGPLHSNSFQTTTRSAPKE